MPTKTAGTRRFSAHPIVLTIGFFVLGLFYFRRTERRFADIA